MYRCSYYFHTAFEVYKDSNNSLFVQILVLQTQTPLKIISPSEMLNNFKIRI